MGEESSRKRDDSSSTPMTCSEIAFLQNTGCLVTAIACMTVLRPAPNPFRFIADLFRSWRQAPWTAAAWGTCLAVMGIDVVLTGFDHRFTAWVGRDFAREIWSIENGTLTAIQALAAPPLDLFFTGVYVLLFPQAFIICLVFYTIDRDRAALRQILAGFTANYVLALPFYVFFPVSEAWSLFPDDGITLRMDAVSPALMAAYRPLSGIDNCFPSLHASIALTMHLVARDQPRPRLAQFTAAVAWLTIASTFYLGIHWITDAVAGVLLALLCHRISRRF